MKVYRTASDLPADRRIKALAGTIIKKFQPGLAAAVHQRPFDAGWGLAGKLIRNAYLAEAVSRGDHETLRRYFTHYWSSSISEEFYEGFAHRFETLFLRHHSCIAERIAESLPDPGEQPFRLVEVGCGDGRVLEWFAESLPNIGEFLGVDLNAREIEKCRERHRRSDRISFHAGDLLEWIQANPAPRTILVTNGGVFEYLLQSELHTLLKELRRLCAPCLVAVTETIGCDHDLGRESESLPYGHELAFSHNYPAALR
jgi:ubiquinone/menaquinone biosynthesis C-methylase UbiE